MDVCRAAQDLAERIEVKEKTPVRVERTTRSVIERKLLVALNEDRGQVAIMATKQDLEDMIAALRGYVLRDWLSDRAKAHIERCDSLAHGLDQLLKEAFSK